MSILKHVIAALLILVAAIGSPALAKDKDGHDYPEARNYDASLDATAAVDAALERANARNTLVLIALGANWCHDSRAFAGWMETERFAELIDIHFELVHVNVGMPQTADGHNLHIAERFGVTGIDGTPTVLIITAEGQLLNAATAKTWRNTASREEQEIYNELADFAANRIAEEPAEDGAGEDAPVSEL